MLGLILSIGVTTAAYYRRIYHKDIPDLVKGILEEPKSSSYKHATTQTDIPPLKVDASVETDIPPPKVDASVETEPQSEFVNVVDTYGDRTWDWPNWNGTSNR